MTGIGWIEDPRVYWMVLSPFFRGNRHKNPKVLFFLTLLKILFQINNID